MLKNCFLPVNYNKRKIRTCGEIVYQSFDEFIFHCKFCKIKIFDFDEFVKHLRNVHENDLIGNVGGGGTSKKSGTDKRCKEELLDDGVEEQRILKSACPTVKTEINEEIDEERIDFDNDRFRWDNNSGDDNEHISGQDKDFGDSDYEQPEEEEEEDDIKSIIRKPRKLKEFACDTCSKKYADERRLHMHVKIVHLREKPFKCDHCDECFAESRSLKAHIGIQHTGFDCPTCHKTFTSSRNLKRHTYLHADVKQFICSEENCGKAFASRGLLRDHRRCHSGEILICEECGYKCRQRESLIVHKRHHTGEKPFGCHLCDSRFGSKPLLKEHMATHETDRNHICDVCGKSFNRPKALYHHKHLHLGIKKFVCKICGSAYAQAAGLSAHMRKHREDSGVFSSEISTNSSNAFYNL